MSNNTNITSRILTGATVVALIFALNVSGALAGFWRTLDGITANGVPNPMEFLFGYGTDGTSFGYGYGYGYGYGDFNAGTGPEVGGGIWSPGGGGGSSTSSSSTSGGGGGGWSSSSSSSSSGGSSSSSSSTSSSSSSSSGGDDTGSSTSSSSTSSGGGAGSSSSSSGGSAGIVFRDYSDQPKLATCGTSIVNFTDIAGTTFEEYIIQLEARSGLNGNGTGTAFNTYTAAGTEFQPNRSATRSEYIKLILRALCIDYSGENSTLDAFSDTGVDVWQAKVVNKAAELGLIDTTNSLFRVNDTISRAEALKISMRAGLLDPFNELPTSSSFSDVPVWSWQSKYTEKALEAGFIAPNATFRPMDAITRGESAKFILNALNLN